MADIGEATPTGTLYLPRVGDWSYTYTVQEGSDPLDENWRLYLAIGEAPTPEIEWDFVIAPGGLSASIKVESTDVQAVSNRVTFWLMLRTDPTDDPGEELLTGRVSR